MMQVVMDGGTAFLPQDIITNILKRIPVKALLRFQCVCKQWKNLIKSPSFIADHLDYSSHQNPLLLFQLKDRDDPLQLHMVDYEMQVREVQNAPLIGSLSFVRIVGSSNGLLCLERYHHGIFPSSLLLWNPAIREVRHVPRTIDDFEGDCRLGFGFSPTVNDYKIVRTYAKFDDGVNRAEVYSLSTGSWKEIDLGNLEGVKLFSETVTANGVMFWFGLKLGVEEEGETSIQLIVSFDIAMEVFTLIPWPALDSNDIYSAKLTVNENKLAILYDIVIGEFESFLIDLWVMEEETAASRERWSLIQKYCDSPDICLLRPVTIWRNKIVCNVDLMPGFDSVIEVENGEPETGLSLFNLDTDEFKMFAIRGCGSGHGHRIFNYAESLVPVGNIHVEEP